MQLAEYRNSPDLWADIAVVHDNGTPLSLTLMSTGDPLTKLAIWCDHAVGEIREQMVDTPNTRTWQETTMRHMRQWLTHEQVPCTLLPRPNRNRAPYAQEA